MRRIVKHVRRRLVDGDGAGMSGRIWGIARMQGSSVEPERSLYLLVRHMLLNIPYSRWELPFIANFAQQPVAPVAVGFAFDTLGRRSVDDSEDATALRGFGHDHLDRIGTGAVDRTHFGNVLD